MKNPDPVQSSAIQKWKDMKFGLFIHWGIYSIPAGVWNGKQIEKLGEQIQRHAHIPNDEYAQLANQFNPVNFDANAIVSLAKQAGMKYVVLTAKHHDGFCMFESQHTDFDIIDATPYKKDILKLLAKACRKHDMKLGVYYSTPDWHFNGPNPEVNPDDNKISVFSKVSKANADYQVNQLKEILSNYGDIAELFFDMGEPTAAQSKRFAETVHQIQPNCMINGRVMNNQGDFITMPDNHVPDVPINTMAWESPGTFYHTWGYKSWVKGDPLTQQVKNQVRKLVQIVARGGNFLLNIGPKSDGSVLAYEKNVLKGVGEWMNTHKDAIHGVSTNPFKQLPFGECTRKGNKLYFHIYNWPENNILVIPGLESKIKSLSMLGQAANKISFSTVGQNKEIDLSGLKEDINLSVLEIEIAEPLQIFDPIVRPNKSNQLLLQANQAIKNGKYGKDSYRSILKDYSRQWDIEVPVTGKYQVEIQYKLKYDQKDFIIETKDDILKFTLQGDSKGKAKAKIIDGNESVKKNIKKKTKLQDRTLVVGVLNLKKSERTCIKIGQGKEFLFTTTTAEFKKQDQKYRSMNIDIESIKLIQLNF